MTAISTLGVLAFAISVFANLSVARAVELQPVGQLACAAPENATCKDYDAVVFVHGIYGNEDTFRNDTKGFDWPVEFSREIAGRKIDVYRLKYDNDMVAWASKVNPSFDGISRDMMRSLKPLRMKGYRTTGFIAHSLGGNLVSTYLHTLKTRWGHAIGAQNAFVITLATPVLGSQWANKASLLKTALGMNDDLLQSLTSNNLYLRMLQEFRTLEDEKAKYFKCRPVDLHAAFEQENLGLVLVVPTDSAVEPIAKLVSSPVVGFPVDHSQIAKPENSQDPIFRWVADRVADEYARIASWDKSHLSLPPDRQLCENLPYYPETPEESP